MVLIGLGNPLMSDEGIGVRLVAEMEARGLVPSGVKCLDMGTAGLGILHVLAGQEKAVFIDCALMGEAPGTLRRFTPEEVVSLGEQPQLSLHEGGLLATLELAGRLGESPDEVVIFGVEPHSLEPGRGLTPVLEAQLEEYLRQLTHELNRAGA